MDETLAAVIAAIAEETGGDGAAIGPATDAGAVPGWDSLAHLRIVFNIEARTGRRIDVDETYGAADVGALAALVERSPREG